jgi:hypothetical protein
MKVVKSIAAVVAGFLAIVFLTSLIDALLAASGIFPARPEEYTTGLSLIALVYRTAFAVVGGLVVAKLAPSEPAKHVIVLAAIGTVIGLAGVVTGWNLPGYPHWYSIALTALTFPAIWYGGQLAIGQKKSS